MSDHQIHCVIKNKRNKSAEANQRITHVGGTNLNGIHWKLAQAEVIHCIETGKWRFNVNVNERVIGVVVAQTLSGDKYLRTEIDDDQVNILWGLPECV